jgi:hypothetical protein
LLLCVAVYVKAVDDVAMATDLDESSCIGKLLRQVSTGYVTMAAHTSAIASTQKDTNTNIIVVFASFLGDIIRIDDRQRGCWIWTSASSIFSDFF